VKTVSGEVVRHSLAITIRVKMVGGGGQPLLPEILDQTDGVGAKSPNFYLFSLVAAQP